MLATFLAACSSTPEGSTETTAPIVTENTAEETTNAVTDEIVTNESATEEKETAESITTLFETTEDETMATESTEIKTETVAETVKETEVTTEAVVVETEKEFVPSPYISEPDDGEGYKHLLLDRAFNLGFGCEWNFGKVYTINSNLKQGDVTYYRDIGKPFYIIPWGLATKGTADSGLIASSGLDQIVHWQIEEGCKDTFVDALGNGPYELNDHRISVNSVVEQNTVDRLLIAQYNDYLHETYPEQYPESSPLLVKTIDSNRKGKIVFSYNSYNDISNSAYSYGERFADNTWPHLLLHQSFKEPVDLAKFSSIDFSMTVKVNRANQINTWPQGESDRYDQPIPTSSAVSPSECTLQSYFFIRSKDNPGELGAFVGFMISSSNASHQREFMGVEQNGIDFYRIDLGNDACAKYGLEGEWLNVGDETTVKVDLIRFLEYVLIKKFDNRNPNSKWYGVGVDDVYLSFFNVGYEYIGNWDCEYELSNVYARGTLKQVAAGEEAYDGKWHVAVDEFECSNTADFSEKTQIIGAATGDDVGNIITHWAGSYPTVSAKYLKYQSGWIAVDGHEIASFKCKVYSYDGNLLKTVDIDLYGVEPTVAEYVANELGYGDGTYAHRVNGTTNVIDLSEYSGQTVKIVFEAELEGSGEIVKMMKMDVMVP